MNDQASLGSIERILEQSLAPVKVSRVHTSYSVPSVNGNHAGRFIANVRNPHYTGHRGLFKDDDHFGL
jgi:hypothetical protein